MLTFGDFISRVAKENPTYDIDLIRLAYEFAEKAHAGQKRKSGDDYIAHPLAVADKLSQLHLDQATIIAGLLHDVPEDTAVSLDELQREFGDDVAHLVTGVTKLGILKYRGIERYAENLRKMFIAMAEDIRVIFIKFADRIDNLKTLYALSPEKQARIAQETIEIYAQIAHRLDMRELRIEMEDLAFFYIAPDDYANVKQIRDARIPQSTRNVEMAIRTLRSELEHQNIHFIDLYGRTKHLYALNYKLKKYSGDVNRIYDLIALRVITQTVGECYQILGIIHSLWKPIPGRLKDFIANPKPNGYQSIHTTVFLPNGFPLECQIRTQEMHEHSEFGIAAHFVYKREDSKDGHAAIAQVQVEWVNKLKEWQSQIKDNDKFLNDVRLDFFKEHIFVFTPRGDAIDLPEDSTPIDFAYHIHTDIGNGCAGAYINQELKSLDTPLKNGDVVEIIVDKNKKTPSEDWINIAKTPVAHDHIKQALNRQRKGFLDRLFGKAQDSE